MRLSPLLSSLLALSALVACEPVEVANLDGDGDGVDAELDCNDANPRVYPGAREVCNGTDDDCDGNVDEDVTQEFWADTDHDGYGDPFNTIDACFVSAGIVQNALDCDDTNIDVRPFAVEQWYDGRDQNCDSLDDFDQDGDGFYPTVYQDAYLAYIQRTGRTALKVGDCDDTQSDVNPFGEEICNNRDDDCNGLRDDGLPQRYYDADQDGFGDPRIHTCATGPLWAEDGSDCDDTNKARYPGVAITVCGDGVDDDCDSYDEPCSPISCFADLDQDGHGDALAIIDDPRLCGGPKTAFLASDCDDTMLWRNPEAVELCGDQVDNDCNGVADDGCPVYLCWADADGDHYGDPYQRLDSSLCGSVGSSWNERDCDDSNQWVNPRGAEQCGDAIDNNCDGQVDEGCTGVECWADADLDGFGDGSAKLSPTACGTSGSAWNHTDCDDTSSAIRPNRREDCSTPIDDDCDGSTTLGCDADCWLDADGDGFGDPNARTPQQEGACDQTPGVVANALDCDDAFAIVNPSTPESCADTLDNNCDGQVNEGCVTAECYLDTDYDGHGDPALPRSGTICQSTNGVSTAGDDCDDTDPYSYPGAMEQCGDHWDNNCDGQIDEGCVLDSCWIDFDQDGYGDDAKPRAGTICASGGGVSVVPGDCDDTDPATNPSVQEQCGDGWDNNCDGQVDEGCNVDQCWADKDTDGYGDPNAILSGTACSSLGVAHKDGDCDDRDAFVNPASPEVCDGVDNNCDRSTDEGCPVDLCWADGDQDGHGDPGAPLFGSACQRVGVSYSPDDCDDANGSIHPSAGELCLDNLDNDCNDFIDDTCPDECWVDSDGDGYGDPSTPPSNAVSVCQSPGHAYNADDCDDAVFDGQWPKLPHWLDADGDTFGDGDPYRSPRYTCAPPPSGYVANNTDCDDRDPTVNPLAGNCVVAEWCTQWSPSTPLDMGMGACSRIPAPVGTLVSSSAFIRDNFQQNPHHIGVNMTPVVARLAGQYGWVDEQAAPQIFATMNDGSTGILRVFDGKSGQDLYTFSGATLPNTVGTPTPYTPLPSGELAVAQLGYDYKPRVVLTLTDGASVPSCVIAAVDVQDSSVLWSTPATMIIPCGQHAPVIADMNNDGTNEVIAAMMVLDGATGAVLFNGDVLRPQGGTGMPGSDLPGGVPEGTHAVVGDIDLDGHMDLIAGNTVWTPFPLQQGTELRCEANDQGVLAEDGYPAYVNVDTDPEAELAIVTPGYLRIFDDTVAGCGLLYTEVHSYNAPAHSGSPPVVGDVDGDGQADIVVMNDDVNNPGKAALFVWRRATQSSAVMGNLNASPQQAPALYDIDGDGDREIFISDRNQVWSFDWNGSNLTTISGVAHNVPGTNSLAEGVAIADIDLDMQADLLVPRGPNPGGVEILRAAPHTRLWAASTQIWNQAMFTPGLTDGFGYPMYVMPMDQLWYREGTHTRDASKPGMPFPTWDLMFDPGQYDPSQITQACQSAPGADVRVQFRVVNSGAAMLASDITIDLVGVNTDSSEVVLASVQSPPVAPGQTSETLLIPFAASHLGQYASYALVVNPANDGDECDTLDNRFVVDTTGFSP